MKRILLILFAILLLTGCAYDPTESEDTKKLEIYAYSIGKADALLLKCEEAAILIDTGENGDGKKILEKLAACGVEKLDLLVLTHFDKDHIGGADKILAKMPVDRVIMPVYEKDSPQYAELSEALSGIDAEVMYLAQDETLTYGELLLSIWASPVPFDGKSDNDQSIIVKALYDGKAYLFMGDAEEAELRSLILSGKNLTCDVLKLPHHGVYDAQLPALLTVTMPSYVIICDSEKNPADEETMKTLSFFDTVILETKDGDIHLISAEKVIKAAKE